MAVGGETKRAAIERRAQRAQFVALRMQILYCSIYVLPTDFKTYTPHSELPTLDTESVRTLVAPRVCSEIPSEPIPRLLLHGGSVIDNPSTSSPDSSASAIAPPLGAIGARAG